MEEDKRIQYYNFIYGKNITFAQSIYIGKIIYFSQYYMFNIHIARNVKLAIFIKENERNMQWSFVCTYNIHTGTDLLISVFQGMPVPSLQKDSMVSYPFMLICKNERCLFSFQSEF